MSDNWPNYTKPGRPTPTRWFYSGDVNIEHGGYFYELGNFDVGFAEVIRVTPCSDAGGPDNQFWVDSLSVVVDSDWKLAFQGVGDTVAQRRAHRQLHDMGAATRVEDALVCCGWDYQLDAWDKLTLAQRRHVIVDALVGYGVFDQESSEVVQIGSKAAPTSERNWHVSGEIKVLRANASLRRYVRAKCDL